MRRTVSALLVLFMLLSLSACGGVPADSVGPAQSAPSGESTQPVAARIEKTDVQAQDPWYLPIDEVGAYNPEIITGEIMDSCTLGEISADALPYWNGLILENKIFASQEPDGRWDAYTPGSRYWTEAQVRFQAEQGFNCIRVLYSFSFLSDPEDICSINMAELEQLDELLSWCMKYNVHMMLSVVGLPGMAGQSREEEDVVYNDALFFDETTREVFQSYWLMLARRYADIPSGALSFELEAEGACDGKDGPDMQRYFDTLSPIAYGIWEISPGRIIIVNDVDKEVPEQLAEIGCCLSLHTHVYNHCGAEEDWYGLTDVEHHWPMEYLPRYFHGPENGTLKLVSENGFRAGSLTACIIIYHGQTPEIRCDGTVVPSETSVNEKGVTLLTAEVPEGTKEIELAPAGGEYNIELILVELNQEGRERVQLNVPIINYVEGQVFPTIRVEDDGTLVNLTGPILDGATLYKNYIQKFVDCAERNHVGFIETEIGTDTTVLSVEEYLAYHTMWLDMLKEHHISWMYNCERNIFAPKELIWLNGENNPIPFEHFSQWEDGPYWVNDDVMELLKAHQ